MLLCDYAEELGGKLYIMGGGWSRLFTPNQPTNMALAIKMLVPWNETNRAHNIGVRLCTQDETPVQNEQGEDIQLIGQMEVGRPAGIRAGSRIDAPLALRFHSISLDPGVYKWEFLVDGTVLDSTIFDVVSPT
jgi:hypothetical protein